jgi:lipoteichoic acid synthase
MTSLRLDIQNNLMEPEYSIETMQDPEDTQTETTGAPTEPTEVTTEATEPVIVYGDNQLDIDFEAKNKSATSKEQKLNNYVSTLTATKQNEFTGLFEGKNLIMITAEAFSAELIDPELTPTLYRLANRGIQFIDYYQPSSAGTTGGEYQNIFGLLPTKGGMSFKKTANHLNYFTMGSQLDRLGYYGKAFHNNSYTYYSRNKTHNNIGYSDGFMGYGNGMEAYVKKTWPQSDYEMISGTLPTYIDKQPFNVYYMSVSGHSGYSRSGNSMTSRHWDRVQHLPYSNKVKGYFAANLDLEDALAHLVNELETKGIADNTVICISSDHFPYGLDSDAKLGDMPYLSELYGYDVDTVFERDHSRLILWSGCLEEMDPIVVDAPTSSLDILPTLSNLFGTEFDSRLMPGRDVFSDAPALVFNTNYDWKTEYGTYFATSGRFVPSVDPAQIPENYVETIKAVVRNKITYCSGVLDADYFRHLFG